jgi:hypothetical protein
MADGIYPDPGRPQPPEFPLGGTGMSTLVRKLACYV